MIDVHVRFRLSQWERCGFPKPHPQQVFPAESTAGGSNGNNVAVVFVLDFGRGEAARPAGVSFGNDELRTGEPLCHSSSWKTTVLENLLDSSKTLGDTGSSEAG